MQDVIDALRKNRFHEALVRLFTALSRDPTRARRSEPRNANDSDFTASKNELASALRLTLAAQSEPPPLEEGNTCAYLLALDQALFDCEPPVPAANRIRVDGEDYWVVRRPFRYLEPTRHERRGDSVRRFIPRHHIAPVRWRPEALPMIHVEISGADDALNQGLQICIDGGVLNAYASSLEDGVRPSWASDRLHAEALRDPETRRASTLAALSSARRGAAHLLVFPELTITPALRDEVAGWLLNEDHSFLLVAAGSFNQTAPDGKWKNVGVLLDRLGRPLLRHEKMRRFTDETGRSEQIDAGTCVQLLATAIGTIGIPICLDFSDEDQNFRALWQDVGVDWLLVPSMGDATTVTMHRRHADTLFRALGTVTIVANQTKADPARAPGFLKDSEAEAPDLDDRTAAIPLPYRA